MPVAPFSIRLETERFNRAIKSFVEDVDDTTGKKLRAVTFKLLGKIIADWHAVDTGRSRAGWHTGAEALGIPWNDVGNDPAAIAEGKSLGEFEQGRPVIEAIRKISNEYKILITFFSPSGYEIRKNYQGADYIFYLPLDTRHNAQKFIDIIRPRKVFFVKYEFWYHYLKILHEGNIPIFLLSGIFRKNQVFFKWYGSWFKRMLKFFSHIFLQNQESGMVQYLVEVL